MCVSSSSPEQLYLHSNSSCLPLKAKRCAEGEVCLLSVLPLFRFVAVEASFSLLTISLSDCTSILVMLLNKARV